jgi:hypothetical protein
MSRRIPYGEHAEDVLDDLYRQQEAAETALAEARTAIERYDTLDPADWPRRDEAGKAEREAERELRHLAELIDEIECALAAAEERSLRGYYRWATR